ncbi:hypothetical protein ACRASQ_09365 [Bacteroides hominis]|uniref:hypothetical protein n=1 Tax=Bacteroides TaxID=816 RepID=UPI003529C605
MKTIVLGAGVDANIDMPLTGELIPQIAEYATTEEGRALDAQLRSVLPRLMFRFEDFVRKTIDRFADEFNREMAIIKESISQELDNNANLTEDEKKMGELIKILMDKLLVMREGTIIDSNTQNLIREVLGEEVLVVDDSLIDYSKIVFTDTFKAVLRTILQRSLNNSNHPILRHVYRNILDIEQLLLKYFIGFYTGHESYMKSYIYITWMLWGYLVSKEKELFTEKGEDFCNLPLYSQLRHQNEWKVISFNYTTFARQFAGDRAIYFHGCLTDYVDIETKISTCINEQEYSEINIENFFENNIKPNIDFTSDAHHYTIPSFLPPLKLKPVIGKKFITEWYNASKALENSDKIIIIGYSFNASDEHFNGLLRDCQHKDIYIIDKDINAILLRLASVLGIDSDRKTQRQVQGKTAFVFNNHLTLIEAEAHEINLSQL